MLLLYWFVFGHLVKSYDSWHPLKLPFERSIGNVEVDRRNDREISV